MGKSLRTVAPALAVVALALGQSGNQPSAADTERNEFFRANYTKYEYLIPMRDGVRLFTAVYVPKDASTTYPILLQRTPYSVGPYGSDNYVYIAPSMEKFVKEKFIFAHQDVRGRNKSEGEFVNARPHNPAKRGPKDIDESTDSYDTIDWLVKNVPQNNGKAGIWGISYPGFYAAMAAIDAHPALKAASPQAPISDWFMGDDWRHNGALFLAHTFNFFASFGRPRVEPGPYAGVVAPVFDRGTPDGYDFFARMGPLRNLDTKLFGVQEGFWKELMQHDSYDAFWQARNIRPHLKSIRPAMMTVGGWFDAEDLLGPFAVYNATEQQSPQASNIIVVGPWSHGGWMGDGDRLGNVRFDAKTAQFFRDEMMLPFFLHHLKGKDDPKLPEAYVFETGRNVWRKHETWPPKAAAERILYFGPGGKLSFSAPDGEGYDEYVSDPARPVPFTDETSPFMTYNYMTSDQRFAARRTDVAVYETEPLGEDVTIAGPIKCNLYVSTTGTDSDWVVKVIDVYPGSYPDPSPNPSGVRMGAYQQLVRGEPFRGRFRNSFDKPEPFVPGRVAKVAFAMPDSYHTFRRGHRIMVHVQSSWFPLVDRNPQKFVPIAQATEADFVKATQRVHRSRQNASAITVQVLR